MQPGCWAPQAWSLHIWQRVHHSADLPLLASTRAMLLQALSPSVLGQHQALCP